VVPWWESSWLWAGIAIVVGSAVVALVAVGLVVALTRIRLPRR
jgi:hypothetical protein